MQGVFQAIFSHGNVLKYSVLRHVRVVAPVVAPVVRPAVFSRSESVTATKLEEHGFESTTIADVLNAKGKGADGSWLWCSTDDTVYDAVQSMTNHNVGALVVLRPGEDKAIAGIITERGWI